MFTPPPVHPLATMHPSILRYGAGPVPDRLTTACLYVTDPGHLYAVAPKRRSVGCSFASDTAAERAAMDACGLAEVPYVHVGDAYFTPGACVVDVGCPNVAHAARTWIETTGETPCTPHQFAALLHIARLLV